MSLDRPDGATLLSRPGGPKSVIVRPYLRFALAAAGLLVAAVPLAVLVPIGVSVGIPVRVIAAGVVALALAIRYARGAHSLRRLALFVLVLETLSVTMVPALLVGYAALAALQSTLGGDLLLSLIDRVTAAMNPLPTTALIVSRYGLAYYVVYLRGYRKLGKWIPPY